MRTYDGVTYRAARQAWLDGDFGSRWDGIRAIAAERGFLFPPAGTVHDDRNAAEPSQRAIVYRVLEDNPAELERIVRRCSSWSQVVDQIIGLERRLGEDAEDSEDAARWERGQEPTHRESVMSLGRILGRIADSAGVES